jgi:hypothetical protein
MLSLPADWTVPVCERLSAALSAEPLNVASNLVILLAAALLARRARAFRATAFVPVSVQALIALIAVVAVASTLYHIAPTRWSLSLDVQAIHVFVLWFTACFARWVLGLPWGASLLAMPLSLGFAWLVNTTAPDFGMYLNRFLPAGLGLPLMALLLWLLRRNAWRAFAGAALTFNVALICHRADAVLCNLLPIGTHFAWHALSGITLFLIAREVLEQAVQITSGGRGSGSYGSPARPVARVAAD